jgi:cell fate regulator YaaT (PSP1 superfamily)
MKTKMPKIGEHAEFNGEEGKVSSLDVLNETIYVELPEARIVKIKSPVFKNGRWVARNREGKEH